MANVERASVLCEAVQKHLTYVLKWYRVLIEECPLCNKSFLCAYKDATSEEVIILPVSSRSTWSVAELASLRECLPIAATAPLSLAVVDPSGVVAIYSVCDGISEDLQHRTWRPSRHFLENPEKFVENESRRAERNFARQRQDRSNPRQEQSSTNQPRPQLPQAMLQDVIVIDD